MDPEPCDWVRNGFEDASFMPLSLSLVLTSFDETLILRRYEDVTQAVVYDPELLMPAIKNGECS